MLISALLLVSSPIWGKVLGLNNWKNGVALHKIGARGFEVKIRSSVLGTLKFNVQVSK